MSTISEAKNYFQIASNRGLSSINYTKYLSSQNENDTLTQSQKMKASLTNWAEQFFYSLLTVGTMINISSFSSMSFSWLAGGGIITAIFLKINFYVSDRNYIQFKELRAPGFLNFHGRLLYIAEVIIKTAIKCLAVYATCVFVPIIGNVIAPIFAFFVSFTNTHLYMDLLVEPFAKYVFPQKQESSQGSRALS
jgi:hypothetical protein